jgi:hypothetical protein
MRTVWRLVRWLFAALSVAVSLGGAIGFAAQQASWNSAPGESIWPLPGLVLLDWAVFGGIGFTGILLAEDRDEPQARPSRFGASWFAIGAFLPLVVLGVLSIGPFVFLSLVALLVAAVLTSFQFDTGWLPRFKLLLIGMVANLVLLLGMILLGRPPF